MHTVGVGSGSSLTSTTRTPVLVEINSVRPSAELTIIPSLA